MRLLRLARALEVISAVGVVILLILAGAGWYNLHQQRETLSGLYVLQSDINSFSAASDSLLVLGGDPGLWAAYRDSAHSIQERLKNLGRNYPDARKAADQIETIVQALEGVNVVGEADAPGGSGSGVGPLALSPRAQVFLTRVSGHGIALDSVVARAIRDRRAELANTTSWVVGIFVAAALLFAVASFSAFRFLHRRLREPVCNLQQTVQAVEDGDFSARARVDREDELGRLARTFNHMLDELAHTLGVRQSLINALPAHIALLDREGTIVDVNHEWRRFGCDNAYADDDDYGVGRNYPAICDQAMGSYAREAAEVSRGVREVLAGRRDLFTLEYPCHQPDQPRWFRVMVNNLARAPGEARELGAVVMHVDITERKLAEQELSRFAYEDPLTGLYSRHGLVAEMERELGDTWPPGGLLVMLDLVRIRDINESFGFSVGDQLITAVGERLESFCDDPVPLVGRTGGDEFLVYLPARDAAQGERLRARMDDVLDQGFVLDGNELRVGARFGYTELGENSRPIEDLIREAEIALYGVVEDGGPGKWGSYTEARDEETRNRVRIAAELRTALERDEFQLYFQPKVALGDGSVIGAEALIRWIHPERGLQPPGLFIPIAEQSQLIGPIGDWALNEACRSLRLWQDAGLSVHRLAVNVSLVQFALGDFSETVRDAVHRHGINPAHLTLEITESVFEQESEELLRQLSAIHDLGVYLSLDDFGTGYSSLRYLHRYPFNEIKVDKSFVFHMLADRYSQEVVNTVLGIARALDASTVAEGIEDETTAAALQASGCFVGQGFYYSKPLDPDVFHRLMAAGSTLPRADER